MRKALLEIESKRFSQKSKSSKIQSRISSPSKIKYVPKIPFNDTLVYSDKKSDESTRLFALNQSAQAKKQSSNKSREENRSRVLVLKNQIDKLFHSKVDKKKVNEVFRMGVSKSNLDSFVKENPKLSYPQLGQKTPITHFMNVKRQENNYLENHYKEVVEIRKENTKKNTENLTREIILKCKKHMYVTNPLNFTQGFRFVDDYINFEKDLQIEKLINAMIDKKFKLKQEVSDTLLKKQFEFNEIRKKKLFLKFQKTIIKCALHFKKINMKLEDYLKLKINCNIKDEKRKWEYLLRAIHEDLLPIATQILVQNRVLVYKEDKFMQTALHIIAKRNRHNFINLFITSGANINAKDSLGRTPLYMACKNNSVETVKILLFELADPFLTPNDGKSLGQVAKNFEILSCVKHAKALHTLYSISSLKAAEKIKNGLEYMFSSEEMKQLNLNRQLCY